MFSTIAYKPLMDSMITMGDFEAGQLNRKDFPDSEHYTRFLTPIDGRDVILIGGSINDRDTLEIYDLANGIVAAGPDVAPSLRQPQHCQQR
jgi:ribose-phosphate pyrophosphokinase